jgi:hypothetical protein
MDVKRYSPNVTIRFPRFWENYGEKTISGNLIKVPFERFEVDSLTGFKFVYQTGIKATRLNKSMPESFELLPSVKTMQPYFGDIADPATFDKW